MNLNTAAIPLRPSPALDVGLTPKQKARLHEVAGLLLEIYQTLARMRRIEAAWIQPGPHDLTAHLPLYASLGLDPRIIYLYSIMPCLEPLPALASSACFYQSCRFFDPRQEAHVREARELHHDYAESLDDPGHELRPWMTALSQIGHRYAMIVMYDAQRHVVFIVDNWSFDNQDPNLRQPESYFSERDEKSGGLVYFEGTQDERTDLPRVRIHDIEAWKRQRGWYHAEREETGEEGEGGRDEDEEEEGEEEREEEGEEEEGDEEDQTDFYLDDLRARPAGDVLRDIILWYCELVDVPGCSADDEDWCGHDDALRAVYRKHGWPGENFDGDAFVVDRARVIPAAKIRFEPEEALPSSLKVLQYVVRASEKAEEAATAQGHEKLVAANDVDEEWVARWGIWNSEQLTRESKDRLTRAEELVAQGRGCQKVEDLPLWEWDQVRRGLEYEQLSLGWLKQRFEDAGTSALPLSQEYVRHAEEQIATLQKACAASQADAERLCPGRSISSLDPNESVTVLEEKTKLEYLAGDLRYLEQCVVDTREWIAQLPDGADEARGLAQKAVDEKLKKMEQLRWEVNRG